MRTKLVLIVALVAVAGLGLTHSTYAATDGLSFSPSSGSYTVGNTFTVTVQEDSGSTAVNTVDAVVDFPSTLQFVSDTVVAPFSFNPNGTDAASGNTVHITRSQLGTSSTGAQTVTVITFEVLSAGSASVSFDAANSDILTATVPPSNVLTNSPGATYTLSNPSSGGGGGTSGGGGSSGGGGTSGPAPAASATKSTKSTSVSVAPTSSSATPVTVPNNSSVAVSTPVTVQPTTVQPDGVKKVEYYLNGKLVDTETKPPYKYNIDTTQLKNGTYKLVSKTYYDNGSVKQATQNLVVKNTAEHTTNLTWLYLLIVAIILLLGLGVNFFGPPGGGPLRRVFQRFTTPSAGHWPAAAVTTTPHGSAPSSFAAPLAPSPSVPGDADSEVDAHLSHLSAPEHPVPGSTVAPSQDQPVQQDKDEPV